MVERPLSTKFGINSLNGFWENAFYGRRTDGRTDDGRLRNGITSAETVKQS